MQPFDHDPFYIPEPAPLAALPLAGMANGTLAAALQELHEAGLDQLDCPVSMDDEGLGLILTTMDSRVTVVLRSFEDGDLAGLVIGAVYISQAALDLYPDDQIKALVRAAEAFRLSWICVTDAHLDALAADAAETIRPDERH